MGKSSNNLFKLFVQMYGFIDSGSARGRSVVLFAVYLYGLIHKTSNIYNTNPVTTQNGNELGTWFILELISMDEILNLKLSIINYLSH